MVDPHLPGDASGYRGLPVAELHLHIEGTIEADLLIDLARRNGLSLPTWDADELTARYVFGDLQSFLDVHYANLAVLRTERDFYDLGHRYLMRAAEAGVRRAEMFFDPQTHVGNGVPLAAVIGGLSAAVQDAASTGISAVLLLSFLRDRGAEEAENIFREALPFREHFVGVALDSTEIGYPPSLFAKVYRMAAAEGLHRVAHAGEEAGPDYVWEAIDLLGVERVDHGNRALEDPALVARLRDEQIPLTVCPLSNVALRTVPSLAEHPLRAMLDAGLVATVNSDDPAYFGGHVDDNFRAVVPALGLSDDQVRTLAANSFRAAFLTEPEREAALADVARWPAAGQ